MGRRFTFLLFPRLAAVYRGDDRTKRADRPTVQKILRRERYSEEMIANTRLAQRPFVAAVVGRENHAACAADHRSRAILDVHAIQRRRGGTLLLLPIETAIAGR